MTGVRMRSRMIGGVKEGSRELGRGREKESRSAFGSIEIPSKPYLAGKDGSNLTMTCQVSDQRPGTKARNHIANK